MEPRLMLMRGRMTNQDALAMLNDSKLWMIFSRQYDQDGNTIQDNKNEVYTEAERTTRITQLSNITDFDHEAISAWWTESKTRKEVAIKLRNYLKTLEA
jgi:hypothetical protein